MCNIFPSKNSIFKYTNKIFLLWFCKCHRQNKKIGVFAADVDQFSCHCIHVCDKFRAHLLLCHC